MFLLTASSSEYMVEKTTKEDRFNWWLPIFGAVGATIFLVPLMAIAPNLVEILYIAVIVPLISLILLTIAIVIAWCKRGLQSLAIFSMLIIYCGVSLLLFKNSENLRTNARWLLWSKDYRAWVLAQPPSPQGELKHIEWDGWGFAGVGDTVVYLVFDPKDSLLTAAKKHAPAKANGIPCEVSSVHRLESHWYTVLFYTDETWNNCS